MKTVVIETMRYALVVTIIVMIVLCLVRARPAEGYRREAFPRGEANYYRSSENQYGIPRCHYGSYTPILTCSEKNRGEIKT